MNKWLAAGLIAILCAPDMAMAACPMELSVYSDQDKIAGLDFRPADQSATITNQFRMVFGNGLQMDGYVMWSESPKRSIGMLHYQCPQGDVTGDELTACTVWQGVIYAVDDKGNIGMMPAQGQPAPKALILADMAFDLSVAENLGDKKPARLPSDIFELSGCQE